jgi:NAD(P)H dehydrogenase (quinone)
MIPEEFPMSPVPPSISLRPRIALAGGTGRVGSALAARLADDPVELLVLTRNPAAACLPPGVAVAAVDFDAPAALAQTLRGVERLFIAHGTSPRQVANEIALIDAAVAAGVRHVVKLSVLGPPSQLHPLDWHMRIEAHLATRDVGYTVLRPSTFADVLARAAEPVAEGTWGGAAGEGRVNFIDAHDVADAARTVLLDGTEPDAQRAYHLTGPRAWSMQEVAAELSRLLGHTVTYHDRSPSQQRALLLAAGVNEFVAGLLLGLDQMFRQSVYSEVTSTVEQLTGTPARPLTEWLAANIAAFRR